MNFQFLGLSVDQWIDLGISVLIIVVVAVLGRWLVRLVLERGFRRVTGMTETTLDDAILNVVSSSPFWIIFFITFNLAINRLTFVPESWDRALNNIFFLIFLIIGFNLTWRLTVCVFKWYKEEIAHRTETKLDDLLVPFLRRVALIILTAVVTIMLLSYFEVDVSGLVATLGIGSLAIALAAQAALGDLFSGVIIMIDQPFRIGDRVDIKDLDTWGDVMDIGLRSTQIRTRDNRMVIVPNGVIGKSLIVNHSYPDIHYRIQVQIQLAYGSDIELARQTMIGAVRTVEGVLPDKPVEALLLEFGESGLNFRLRWWIESYIDTRRMFDSVNSSVYKALTEAGIELPLPQREIYHKFDPSEAGKIADLFREDSPSL